MNLLMLSDVYFPRVNGVSTAIRTYMRALLDMGHSVTLVAPDYGAANAEYDHEFEVIRLPARTIFFDPEDRLIRGDALTACMQDLARRHWDVVHIHTPFRAHQLGVRLARQLGRPTVETYHTYFEEYIAHYLPWAPKPMLRALARQLSRKLCHEVGHLIVPSHEMVAVLDRYGVRTPSTVLPTGIDLSEFAGGDGDAFRRAHGIAPERKVLLTVGRLAAEKNIVFLLRMLLRLRQHHPEVLYLIAGEGPEAARLRAQVTQFGLQGNVLFVGNLDRRTSLLDCYRAADVFVFASPTETQGLVLIEAMALGLPIVSTAVMGSAMVLRDARSAVISREQEAEFAEHVAGLLDDHARRQQLAALGPADADAWSVETLMRRAEQLYGELATA